MGSGSSKAKKGQPQDKSKTSVKIPDGKKIDNKKQDFKTATEINPANGKTAIDSSKNNNKIVTSLEKSDKIEREQKIQGNDRSGNDFKPRRTEPVRDLGKFGSDSESDSEEEDISAVLAATRTENQQRIEEQNRINRQRQVEEYPETYAQRLQREQYRQQQQALLRQKTIYRNPEEWEIEDTFEAKKRDVDSFDAQKFKAVNAVKTQNKDIYENPVSTDIFGDQPAAEPDAFYTKQPTRDTRSVPSYDTSEEALLAEIEQEYNI